MLWCCDEFVLEQIVLPCRFFSWLTSLLLLGGRLLRSLIPRIKNSCVRGSRRCRCTSRHVLSLRHLMLSIATTGHNPSWASKGILYKMPRKLSLNFPTHLSYTYFSHIYIYPFPRLEVCPVLCTFSSRLTNWDICRTSCSTCQLNHHADEYKHAAGCGNYLLPFFIQLPDTASTPPCLSALPCAASPLKFSCMHHVALRVKPLS